MITYVDKNLDIEVRIPVCEAVASFHALSDAVNYLAIYLPCAECPANYKCLGRVKSDLGTCAVVIEQALIHQNRGGMENE